MRWFIVSPSKYSESGDTSYFSIDAYILGGCDKLFSFLFFKSCTLPQTIPWPVDSDLSCWSFCGLRHVPFSTPCHVPPISAALIPFYFECCRLTKSIHHEHTPSPRTINPWPFGKHQLVDALFHIKRPSVFWTYAWPLVQPYSSSLPPNWHSS